jgi:hypothetical protein
MAGRRMIPDYQALVNKGYEYIAVGSPTMDGTAAPAEQEEEPMLVATPHLALG